MATEQLGRRGLDDGLRIEHPPFHIPAAVGVYPLYLNAPTDGSITRIYFQCDAATNVAFKVTLDTTDITWVTGASVTNTATTTAGTNTATATNTFSAGDAIKVEITSVSGSPTLLTGQLVIEIPEVDA